MDSVRMAPRPISQNFAVKIDHIFVILIVLSGFLVYLHHLFPDVKVWKTHLFEFAPQASYSVQTFFYIVCIKLTPIILLSVWFLSDNHWWRWGIVFPLGYIAFQFLSLINDNFKWNIGENLMSSLPFILGFIVFLVFLRFKLRYHLINFRARYSIDAENLHLIPDHRQNTVRLNRVKELLLNDIFDRKELQLVYREYEFLKTLQRNLSGGRVLSDDRVSKNRWFFGLKFILELLVFLLLITMPFIFSFYDLVETGIDRIDLLFFIIEDHGFQDVRTLLWVLCTKLVVVLPVSVWFFTSRYWWKYFLLIPFSVWAFQVVELFKPIEAIDGVEFIFVLPVVIAVLGVMIVISLRIRRYLDLREFYSSMEYKINETIKTIAGNTENAEKQELKRELGKLMQDYKKYPPEAYLNALREIKHRLDKMKEEL